MARVSETLRMTTGGGDIGLEFGRLEASGNVIREKPGDAGVVVFSASVYAGEAAAGDDLRLFEDAGLFGTASKIFGDRGDPGLR